MSRELSRGDIVNQTVREVWQTPWNYNDRWFTCETYVELSNGACFQLKGQEYLQVEPVPQVDLTKVRLIPAALNINSFEDGFPTELGGAVSCRGETVCEVVTSEMWVTPGLLLSSREFLIATAYTEGVFGPRLFPVGDFYTLAEVITYWGHRPLTASVFSKCG